MTRDVNLRDAISGDGIDVRERVETVVLRRDVNVVYVEKDAAIGALDDFVEKLPLGHFGDVKFGGAGDGLDDDRDFEVIANFLDFLRGDAGGFERIRHGKEIVGVAAGDTHPDEFT